MHATFAFVIATAAPTAVAAQTELSPELSPELSLELSPDRSIDPPGGGGHAAPLALEGALAQDDSDDDAGGEGEQPPPPPGEDAAEASPEAEDAPPHDGGEDGADEGGADESSALAQEGDSRGESGFMDVRLNLTLTNENVFAEPGETIPSVPGWRFGQPSTLGTMFFDNYDTRFSGYETMSHMVLYRQHNVDSWEAEGALVLRINNLAQDSIDLSDAGSYLRVAYWFDEDRIDQRRISLTAFPTSSDRFRLGYSYRLSWGGDPTYQRSEGAVPGMRLQYDTGDFYTFVGAKSAVVLDRETSEEKAVMGALAGVGYDVTDMVRLELNSGYFNRGNNELQDVIDQSVALYGASAQVAVHDGYPIGTSVDYQLYRNDPERVGRLFMPESYPGGLSWLVKGEFSLLGQTLKDPNVTGGTTTQPATAGDVNVRVKYDRTRFRFDASYRDLAFVLHETPSLPTYSAFPDSYYMEPNFFFAGGADHNFEGTGFTLGLILGIDFPATLSTPTGGIPGDDAVGSGYSTAVVRDVDSIAILPEGDRALPQFAGKLTGRIDFNRYFAGLVDAYYAYDPNQTRLRREGRTDPLRREYGELNQLGFNFTLQSRF